MHKYAVRTAVTLQSISATSNTPALSRVEVAILPALIAMLLLAFVGGIILWRLA